MKAYKGFDKDMKCRGFQFAEGQTYEENSAKLCETGFHACEAPIDCFAYYAPSDSVYHEVELGEVSDERGDDSKVCGKKIKIGARLTIGQLVNAQIDYVKEHTTKNGNGHSTGYRSANSATGDGSANSATGNWSANSATGYRSANSATGDWSANSATGNWSANSATGDWSANSATGYWSANSATGDWSANSATGDWSANSATGYGSANVSTGNECSNTAGEGVISVGWGRNNRCRGEIGSYMVLCERGAWNGKTYPLVGEPILLKVDGENIKANTWYWLKDGKVEQWEGEGK